MPIAIDTAEIDIITLKRMLSSGIAYRVKASRPPATMIVSEMNFAFCIFTIFPLTFKFHQFDFDENCNPSAINTSTVLTSFIFSLLIPKRHIRVAMSSVQTSGTVRSI